MFAQQQQEGLPPVGSIIGGKFEIVRLLGMGGMGAVFEARHQITGKSVALKWLKATTAEEQVGVARFVREAQAAGRVHHPHVVDVYDVGQHGEGHFLVMELLRGEALSDRLERERLGLEEAVSLLVPAIQAVGAAHRQGVVHRDLKPDNIFLCHNEDGTVWGPKVLDFGISKVSDTTAPSLTQSGTTLGTPHYMSPEQIRGLADTDYRTDIYALGVILYEALSGNVPFDGDSYGAIAIDIATASPTPLMHLRGDLPAVMGDIVAKAMARNPAERFQSADELASALAALSSNPGLRSSGTAPVLVLGEGRPPTGSVALPESGVQPALRASSSKAPAKSRAASWAIVSAVALVVLAVGAGAAIWLTQSAPASAPPAATTTVPAATLEAAPAAPAPVPATAEPQPREAPAVVAVEQAPTATTAADEVEEGASMDEGSPAIPAGEAPPAAEASPATETPRTSRGGRGTTRQRPAAAPAAPGRSGRLSSDDF